MRRRTALALATSLLSGCAGFGDESTERSAPTARHPTGATTTDSRTTAEPTDTPGSDGPSPELIPADPASATATEIRNRVETVGCEGLSELPVVCGDGDDRLELSLSQRVASLPNGAIEFTIGNGADELFRWRDHSWRLQKWDGSRWRWIAPGSVPMSVDRLEPGASHTYRIVADNTAFHGTYFYVERDDIPLSGIGPGVYGFAVDGYFDSSPEEEFEVAGVFGFAGEGPPVRPTDAITTVERRGDELLVGTDVNDRREVLVVSLVDGAAEVALLPEHVRQTAGVRNTLAYAATDGVESIRYFGEAGAASTALQYLDLVTPTGTDRYGFRDYVFEAASERV